VTVRVTPRDGACGEDVIGRVEFNYRRADQDSWSTLFLTGGPEYTAVLPADLVEYPGVAYRVKVVDLRGNWQVVPSFGHWGFTVPWHSHAYYPDLPPIAQDPDLPNPPPPPTGPPCAPANFDCEHDDRTATSNCCESTAAAEPGVSLRCDANFFGGTCVRCGVYGTPCDQEIGGCCVGYTCRPVGANSSHCFREQ